MRVSLIEADNLSSPARMDKAFQALETAEGSLAVRRANGRSENHKGLADTLRTWAIRPFENLSLSKNTTDVALAADAMAFACQQSAPAMIVIGAGDEDFVPLVLRLRERRIQVVCVSEASKMTPEAVAACDRVVYVWHGAVARRTPPLPPTAAESAKARPTAQRVSPRVASSVHISERPLCAGVRSAQRHGLPRRALQPLDQGVGRPWHFEVGGINPFHLRLSVSALVGVPFGGVRWFSPRGRC